MPPVTGGEPYLTALSDGTLMMTGDPFRRTPDGGDRSTYHFVHRSEDGGATWTNPETASVPSNGNVMVGARNVLQLPDRSLFFGFSDRDDTNPARTGPREYIRRSLDGGRTWSETFSACIEGVPKGYPYAMFEETHLWQARSGRIYALMRVHPGEFPLSNRAVPSIPPGRTYMDMRDEWTPGQRPYTPMNQVSGGGFGPTVEMSGGMLISAYSYRTGKDNKEDLHTEVVRWRLLSR